MPAADSKSGVEIRFNTPNHSNKEGSDSVTSSRREGSLRRLRINETANGCPERVISYIRGDSDRTIADRHDHLTWTEIHEAYMSHIRPLQGL
jgi:hypothetical protein